MLPLLLALYFSLILRSALWQWLCSFQALGTKLERSLHKNQHTQRNYWILSKLLSLSKNVNNKKCACKLVKSRGPSYVWRHQKSRSVCVKQALNTWHVSYKIDFILQRKKKLRKIQMNFDIENWLWKSNFVTFWQLAINPKLKIQ